MDEINEFDEIDEIDETDKTDSCSICYDKITSTTGKTILSCNHMFHLNCIVTWFQQKTECPMCRNKLTLFEQLPEIANRTITTIYLYFNNNSYNEGYNEGYNKGYKRGALFILVPLPTLCLFFGAFMFGYLKVNIRKT